METCTKGLITHPIFFVSLVCVAIVVGSLLPIPFDRFDKLMHLATYCFLSFLLLVLFPTQKWLWIVLTILGGVGLEILQGFSLLGQRQFSYGDIVANTSGVVLGFLGLVLKVKIYD